jgi:hypothetical protein
VKLFYESSERARAEALFGGTGALPGTYTWLWSDCLSCMRPRPLSRLTSSWEVDSYCVRYGRRLQLVCHFVMAHDMPSLVLCKIQKPFREEWRPKVDRRRANKIAHNLLYLDRFISRKKTQFAWPFNLLCSCRNPLKIFLFSPSTNYFWITRPSTHASVWASTFILIIRKYCLLLLDTS